MTTRVTVKALHGWPVRATKVQADGTVIRESIVPNGKEEDFYVFGNQDLFIHEIQPGEVDFDPKPSE